MQKLTPKIGILIGALVTPPSIAALDATYMAGVGTKPWEVATSKLHCSMIHTIPEYGRMSFAQHAGEPEQSSLEVWYGRGVKNQFGELYFTAPHWMPDKTKQSGWKFTFGEHGAPIDFSARQTRTILDALDQGMLPTILHRNQTNLRKLVEAKISTVSFQENYQKYAMCQANIVPLTFDEIRNTNVFFENGSIRLDVRTRKWLEYVTAYADDPDIRKIEISGYTDSIGSFRANHKLASGRVENVRDYLLKAGIPERLMKLKVYGEQRPLANNRSAHGREQNRRVNIKIWR